MKSINPATGEVLASFAPYDQAEIDRRLARAIETFRSWKLTSFAERSALMTRGAEILEADSASLGRLITLEMGKPVGAAVDEVLKCARGCRYYAENAAAFLAEQTISTEASRSFIRYEPPMSPPSCRGTFPGRCFASPRRR
jgi:succinate-semialdehyde dehydrogenase/glutarate-semialdehyde dehydrogenase